MEMVLRVVVRVVIVASYFATWIQIALSGAGIDMWGLAWHWWALISFVILSVSMGFIYYELHSRIRQLESVDTRLTREERKLNIKNGLFDFWQKTGESMVQMPDDLKKKIDELK
jgi:hypothetical protein